MDPSAKLRRLSHRILCRRNVVGSGASRVPAATPVCVRLLGRIAASLAAKLGAVDGVTRARGVCAALYGVLLCHVGLLSPAGDQNATRTLNRVRLIGRHSPNPQLLAGNSRAMRAPARIEVQERKRAAFLRTGVFFVPVARSESFRSATRLSSRKVLNAGCRNRPLPPMP